VFPRLVYLAYIRACNTIDLISVPDQSLFGLTRLQSYQDKQGERPAMHDEVINEHMQIHTLKKKKKRKERKETATLFLLLYIPYPSKAR
jgi:hypothetical protein